MIIRKARKSDVRKISLMRRKTIRAINSKIYPKKIIEILIEKNSTKNILQKMKERMIFCAFENDILLGTIDFEGNKIGGLYVNPKYLKKGIGKKLLDYLETYSKKKGVKRLMLYSTLTAEKFYIKQGYKLKKNEIGWENICPVRVPVMEKKLR